uniref:Uncharacterized protein n=1 Tax=Oryza brachyantha TaxID=4533 RepID=J3MQA1_ORYBR
MERAGVIEALLLSAMAAASLLVTGGDACDGAPWMSAVAACQQASTAGVMSQLFDPIYFPIFPALTHTTCEARYDFIPHGVAPPCANSYSISSPGILDRPDLSSSLSLVMITPPLTDIGLKSPAQLETNQPFPSTDIAT